MRTDLRDEARSELDRIVRETAAAGLDRETALCRLAIGKILTRTADNAQAEALLRQARDGLRQAGDRASEVAALIALGFQSSKRGDFPEGLALTSQAVAIAREIGDRWSEGEALNTQLVLLNWADDAKGVLETRDLALRALRESENRQTLLATLNNLALDAIEHRDRDLVSFNKLLEKYVVVVLER